MDPRFWGLPTGRSVMEQVPEQTQGREPLQLGFLLTDPARSWLQGARFELFPEHMVPPDSLPNIDLAGLCPLCPGPRNGCFRCVAANRGFLAHRMCERCRLDGPRGECGCWRRDQKPPTQMPPTRPSFLKAVSPTDQGNLMQSDIDELRRGASSR